MRFEFAIEPLGRKHRRDNFDCGEESLNAFLRLYARQNSERGLGKTFVAVRPGIAEVFGYYTISSGSISFEIVPENLPRYPIPTAHMGRLGVDLRVRGQGLGEFLLMDALKRILSAAERLGIYAIDVVAKNSPARNFYLKYGFIELKDDENHLYLPVATVRKSGLV
jgi:GNAT superfamily N-acetyltransferase